MFGKIVKIKEATWDIVVFGLSKGALSELTSEERVKTIITQNSNLVNSLQKVGVLKGAKERVYKTTILGLVDVEAVNKIINSGIC